jgi:hypothetical protein
MLVLIGGGGSDDGCGSVVLVLIGGGGDDGCGAWL